jgi:hypothetical protein
MQAAELMSRRVSLFRRKVAIARAGASDNKNPTVPLMITWPLIKA